MTIWHLLWPDFWSATYPNVLASLLWAVPGFVGQHFALRRHHRRVLAEHVEALRRSQTDAANRQADKVSALVGEALDAAHDKLLAAVTEKTQAAARSRWRGW